MVILFSSVWKNGNAQVINRDKIYAWCIVPYDSEQRTPVERIEMLKSLGITKYAYDWRSDDLSSMAKELKIAKQNDVDVIAVWVWIDANWDSVDKLNDSNEKVFSVVEKVGYTGQIWVSFNANYFENLSDADAISKGADMISYLSKRANALGCKLALYNHGDWFGEPKNQVEIIKALPNEDLGLVYNFHHAHKQLGEFPEMVKTMMPYLWYVNLNGIREGGPKILTLGKGDYEREMIQQLLDAGYKGDFGILGHIEDQDVEKVLKANMAGFEEMGL